MSIYKQYIDGCSYHETSPLHIHSGTFAACHTLDVPHFSSTCHAVDSGSVWTIMSSFCPPLLEQPILLSWDVSLPPEGSRVHRGRSPEEWWALHQTRPRSVFIQPPPTPRVHPHPANTRRQGLEQEVQRGESCYTKKDHGSAKEGSLKFLRIVCLSYRWMLSSKRISTKPQSSFLKRLTMNPSLLPVWLRFMKQNCLMGLLSLWRSALIVTPYFIPFSLFFFIACFLAWSISGIGIILQKRSNSRFLS